MKRITINNDGGSDISFWVPQDVTAGEVELITKVFRGEEYPPLPDIPDYSPKLILDVGANLGAFSHFIKGTYPACKLISFEPSPRNFTILQQNLMDFENIELVNKGLFNKDGKVELHLGNAESGLTDSIHPNILSSEQIVSVEMLDAGTYLNCLNSKDISILKIDTEGCEYAILDSIGEALARVDAIYLEYHHEKDRIAIDKLLGKAFVLFFASAKVPHRGTVCYLRKELVQRAGLNIRGIG